MKYTQGQYKIIKKTTIAKNCYSFIIDCPEVAQIASAGQFVHIKADGFTLRRPISICEIDKTNGTIRIVFEIRGEGTEVIASIKEDSDIDMIAPLGRGFTILDSQSKAIVVGGGIGVPPLLEVAKNYKENATAIIGFSSSPSVILAEDFESLGCNTLVCTDDGTRGEKGFVTATLIKYLEQNCADIIYACGPLGMIKGVVEIAEKYGVRCEVSLEERMACGVGACLGCACKTNNYGADYFAHVCKDGPVFNAKEVVFD